VERAIGGGLNRAGVRGLGSLWEKKISLRRKYAKATRGEKEQTREDVFPWEGRKNG